jgi:hypothetical protein
MKMAEMYYFNVGVAEGKSLLEKAKSLMTTRRKTMSKDSSTGPESIQDSAMHDHHVARAPQEEDKEEEDEEELRTHTSFK